MNDHAQNKPVHTRPHPTDPTKPPIAVPDSGTLGLSKRAREMQTIQPHVDMTGAGSQRNPVGSPSHYTPPTMPGGIPVGQAPGAMTVGGMAPAYGQSGPTGMPPQPPMRAAGGPAPMQSPARVVGGHHPIEAEMGQTVGAPARPVQVEPLVIPQFLPIFDRGLASPVPYGIPLRDGDSIDIDFEVPRGILGPLDVIGLYVMHCVPTDPQTDPNAANHPLIWTNPQQGVYSDAQPIATGPPEFVGAREGDRFLYSLSLSGDRQYTFTHNHQNHNLLTLPLPVQVPAGSQGKLTIIRQPTPRYLPGQTVYIMAGLFGRLFHTVTPPFPLSACKNPVRPASYTTASVSIPAPNTPIGTLSAPVTEFLEINEHFPTIFSHLLASGDDHLFLRFSWQVGFMMQEFVPIRVFHYMTAGGWLPAFVLTNGSSRFMIELANPSLVPNQEAAHAAVSIEGASYGFGGM